MDSGLAAKVVQAASILHNMIVGARHVRYKMEYYKLAQETVDKSSCLDESGEKKEFRWSTQCDVLRDSADSSGTGWATDVAKVDRRVTDPHLHHVLKL